MYVKVEGVTRYGPYEKIQDIQRNLIIRDTCKFNKDVKAERIGKEKSSLKMKMDFTLLIQKRKSKNNYFQNVVHGRNKGRFAHSRI